MHMIVLLLIIGIVIASIVWLVSAMMHRADSPRVPARHSPGAEEAELERQEQPAAQEARARQLQAEQESRARAQQAAQEAMARLKARKLAAIPAIHVTSSGFSDCGFNMCTFMKVEVINGSKEALSSISIGLSTVLTSGDACPTSYAKQEKLNIKLSPGERRGALIDFVDIEFSKHPVCIKVLDVDFVDAAPTPQQIGSCQGAGGISPDLRIDECTALIQSGPWSGQALAWAYRNRGLAYKAKDDNGRAIADYDQSIRLDPKYAPAYGNRGYTYFTKGDYDRAIADYDQAIRLDPKPSIAYFNRGLANFYAGALSKALADLNQTRALDPKYAYAALWLDIVGQRNDIPSRLSQAISTIDMTAWPAPVIRMFLGEIPPAAVLTAADDPDATKKSGQICEANFYSGEWALRKGAKDEAARLFRLATSDCPKNFVERAAANAELKALGESP